MWKITKILPLLSLCCFLCVPTASGSYIDNVIEEQHKLINEMNQNFTDLEKASEKLINLGTFVGNHKVPPKTVKITNTVAVKVPVPYPVQIPHPVPVPVTVNRPVPITVPKIVKVPEATPVATVPSYATTPEAIPTAAAYSSPTGTSQLLSGEQETANSRTNEQLSEFMHSYPVHSVYDVGVNYNPYTGNRLALSKQTGAASEDQPKRYYGSELQQLQEYSGAGTKHTEVVHGGYQQSFHSTAQPEVASTASHGYHGYYSTAQPEVGPTADHGMHPEITPNSYKSPKSTYFAKDYEKYPTPKFPRPTSSPFPTNPSYSTKDPSYGREENHFETQHFKEYHHHKPTATAPSFQTVKDAYPRYEQPDDTRHYHYQKPTAESYSSSYSGQQQAETGGHHHGPSKYIEHYQKPAELTYPSGYHGSEHKQESEPTVNYQHYEQEQSESHYSKPEHRAPTGQYESNEVYGRTAATAESSYSHYEPKESQYVPQEYKAYYSKPTPVSEALTYLKEKEPSEHSEPKEYHMNHQIYHHTPSKDHKTQYSSKPSAIAYNFPSDSHLHPESSSSKHKSHHQYYSSSPEQPSFDEDAYSERKYYQQHSSHQHSPSPSPSSSSSYGHAVASDRDFNLHQYRSSQHHHHHHQSHPHRHLQHNYSGESSDMEQSSSKDNEAYERAVEQNHRASHPNEYADYSHEHLHHHHPASDEASY